VPGRALRTAIGLVLLCVPAWLLWPSLWTITSTAAVVNAQLITLTSPIEGVATLAPPAVGQQVARGGLLLRIAAPLPDQKHVEELEAEKATLTERVAALQQHAAKIQSLKNELSVSFENYKSSLVREVADELEEARSEAEAAEAIRRQKEFEQEREQALVRRGFGRPPELNAARYAAEVAVNNAARARAGVSRLTHQLESIQRGVFTGPGDSRNDVPYSRQRAHELLVQQLDDEAKIQEHQMRIAQIEQQIVSETSRIEKRTSQEVRAPVDGIIGRLFVAAGSSVGPQSELLQVLDASTVFIDARLSENYADDVRPGNAVRVRLIGPNIEVGGTIRHVLGDAVPGDDRTTVAASPVSTAHEVHVIVDFDKAAAGAGQFNQFLVGRRVEVRFPGVARSHFGMRKSRS
jgi:multidrug resistance efflux pump